MGTSISLVGVLFLTSFWAQSLSLCRFALPALLPLITPDLQLTDTQGSMLTSGYTVLPSHYFLEGYLVNSPIY